MLGDGRADKSLLFDFELAVAKPLLFTALQPVHQQLRSASALMAQLVILIQGQDVHG